MQNAYRNFTHTANNQAVALRSLVETLEIKKIRDNNTEFNKYYSMILERLDEVIILPANFFRYLVPDFATVEEAANAIAKTMEEKFANYGIEIDINVEPIHISEKNRRTIADIFIHTLQNAYEALKIQGSNERNIFVTVKANDENAEFIIRDNGPGFENIDLALQPDYTTKPTQGGFGLFWIDQAVRFDLNGTVALDNERGATVKVTLPMHNNGENYEI